MLGLGVDIGGTNARAAVVDQSTGQLVVAVKEALVDRSPTGVASVVASLVERAGRGHPVAGAPVGVGFAGMLRGDVVVNAPNLGWRDVDFGGPLAQRLGRPVRLVNDLSAAAWGELKGGAARGASDSFTCFVGTGVGSAIIAGGRLLSGATGVAGEFGHVKLVAEGGRACGCGQLGCLEAYVGGAKLTEWMAESGLSGTPSDLEKLALEGEAVAKGLYDFAVGHLALAIANQVTVLNPDVLVLGGGVLMRCPGMVRRITDVVMERTSVAARQHLRIRLAELGDDSGLVGAALLAVG
ncbi:MAG: ROK family protein [Myxococcaceae bacterium]|jgi:glucokinase|nr:ROK family protein [Myxococcaceae bacterium]